MPRHDIEPLTPWAHGVDASLTPEQKKDKAFAKLREYVERNATSARAAVERIMREVPQDALVKATRGYVDLDNVSSNLRLNAPGDFGGVLSDHALVQLAERAGMPVRYLNQLRTTTWGQELVVENLNRLLDHRPEDEKFLVRRVDGQVRGVLSPSYRTDDSRPALDALIGVANDYGAVVAAASALDTKTSVKVMLREPVELFPGEWAVLGVDYRNSDYGDGAREVMGWVLRLLCLNGAVTVANYRRVHLGRRIDDEVEYSTRTRQLNAEFTASATRDMAKALLGPEAVRKLVEGVRAANATALDPEMAVRSLRSRVNKEEEKAIVQKFNSPDVELLPPGNTTWRFSNAVSWLATQTGDDRRRLELEQLAGEFVPAAA